MYYMTVIITVQLQSNIFLDNGCQDHYESAGEICIRPSAYPETYENAQAQCQSEGASLLHITSQEVQVGSICSYQ